MARAICVLALAFTASSAAASDFEASPVLEASAIAGPIPLVGPGYSIAETVPTDGFMASVHVASPFGDFAASGPGMLAVRIGEIGALAALQQIRADARFREAAGAELGETAGALQRLAAHPRETLEGVPQGVGRFFRRTGRSVRTGLQKLDDLRDGELPGVGPAPVSTLPGGSEGLAPAPDGTMTEQIARAGGDVALNMLGFDEERRRLAQQLGVDPYTTNAVLAAELDEVTWAAFGGGLGVNVLTSMVPGGMLISTSSRLTTWVWDTAPGDLRVEIERALRAAGTSADETDRFLRHYWYPLSMQAVLAAAVQALDGVVGREALVGFALTAGSEGQARFITQTLDMLRSYHETQAPLTALEIDGTLVARTATGDRVVMAPVDHLSWSPVLARFATRLSETDGPLVLVVSGGRSERADAELERLGWQLQAADALGPLRYPVVTASH